MRRRTDYKFKSLAFRIKVVDVALASELSKLAVQVLLGGDDFVVCGLVVLEVVVEVAGVGHVVDVEWALLKLLVGHRV